MGDADFTEDNDFFLVKDGCINILSRTTSESEELLKPILWPVYNCLREVWSQDPEMDFSTFADLTMMSLKESLEKLGTTSISFDND